MCFRFLKLAVFFTIGLYQAAWSQGTMMQSEEDALFLEGLDLYDKERYPAAQRTFQEYLSKENDHGREKIIQAEYYVAISALKIGDSDFESRVTQFIRKYPSHPKVREAYFHLGSHYFDQGDYGSAMQYFSHYELPGIRSEEDAEAAYKLAYTHFALDQYDEAVRLFDVVKQTNSEYARVASYYAGYIHFQQNNYDQALIDLERANLSGDLADDAKALMAGIYYKQGRYGEIIQMAPQGPTATDPELALLVGEAYYLQTDYASALPYFERFLTETSNPADRQTNYRIGYTMLQESRAEQAVPFLSRSADGQDTLAQLGAYHLGMAYLAQQETNQAVIALNNASKMDYDQIVKENAAYYLIRASYDAGDFSSVIDGAELYLSSFPNGTYINEAYNLLGEAYQRTGDYDRAIQYLSRIERKTDQVKAAYQRVTFNKSALLYNDGNYREAVFTLKQSLTYPMDTELTAQANYWLGEVYSLGSRYDTALIYYQRVPFNSSQYRMTLYGMAYAYYNTQQYQQAAALFQQFLNNPLTNSPGLVADGYTRLGDCNYVLKQYSNAIAYYDQALQRKTPDPDYIFYQKGMVYKYSNQLDNAIKNFDQVINNYPASSNRAKAYYQKAEINFDDGRVTEAIRLYTQIIEQYPENPLMPYALAKRGLAASIAGQYEMAVQDQKRIIDEFIVNKELAETAIEQLQGINSKGYPVNGLTAYINKFTEVYKESEVVVKSRFDAAMQPFNNGEYLAAIGSLKKFIEGNPASRYANEAYFNIGFSYEVLEDFPKAVESYKKVEGEQRERAVKNVADLSLEQLENYSDAVSYYSELIQITSRKKYREAATAGLMKGYLALKDYDAVDQYADEILDGNMSRYKSEAWLYKGKAMLARQQYTSAIGFFQETIQLGKDESAAEAQYLIGKSLRAQGQYETSTEELIKVRTEFGSYQEWLYEAFLLIAENYISIDNKFQAKATLQSIVDYSEDESVKNRAKQRLEQLK